MFQFLQFRIQRIIPIRIDNRFYYIVLMYVLIFKYTLRIHLFLIQIAILSNEFFLKKRQVIHSKSIIFLSWILRNLWGIKRLKFLVLEKTIVFQLIILIINIEFNIAGHFRYNVFTIYTWMKWGLCAWLLVYIFL